MNSIHAQEANRLVLARQVLPKDRLDCYKGRRRWKHVYEASAKLWAEGVEWSRALAIVNEAFDATVVEANAR